MGRRVSMATRNELLEALRPRYRSATRLEKGRILDEFVALSGHHRKHAIRLLNQMADPEKKERQVRRVYDEAVRQALVILWEASDRLCGKRLRVMLPVLVEALERHGHLALDDELRERLLAVSPATIDRLLSPTRERVGRKRRRSGPASAVRRRIPVRTFSDWGSPVPGYFEADFVAHHGGSMAGSFLYTFVVTDIASGWTEGLPLVARQQDLVVAALDVFRQQLPVEMKGFDTDNDSAFMNETVFDYCKRHDIEQTRSRAYRKNDQAWVEQKNGAVVRRMVGYDRFGGVRAAQYLARLLSAARLLVNYFQPSYKLRKKTRIGAKVKKEYFPPATPCDRLLADPRVSLDVKTRLREERTGLDPVWLLKEIREAQGDLTNLNEEEDAADAEISLDAFLSALPRLWEQGEVRPTHRKKPTAPRTWRTRKDPFESVWPGVLEWLDVDPDANAKVLFHRLQAESPGSFQDGQLRTLQRRVRAWRRERAADLLQIATSGRPSSGESTAALHRPRRVLPAALPYAEIDAAFGRAVPVQAADLPE
jgi:hypothetical protein